MNDLLILFLIIALAVGAMVFVIAAGAWGIANRCTQVLQAKHEPTLQKPTPLKCHKCNDSGLLIDRGAHAYHPTKCDCLSMPA